MNNALLCLCFLAAILIGDNAIADINLNPFCYGGLLIHNGSTFPNDALPSGALIQLTWAKYEQYSPSLSTGTGDPTVNSLTHCIIWSGYTTHDGYFEQNLDGMVTYTDDNVGGNDINAGYIYLRVFETASPSTGTWYSSSIIYDTSTFAEATNLPPPLPSDIDATTGPGAIYWEEAECYLNPANHGQVVVVPEPSTITLLTISLLTILYKWRK